MGVLPDDTIFGQPNFRLVPARLSRLGASALYATVHAITTDQEQPESLMLSEKAPASRFIGL